MNFGDKIREARKSKKLTQRQFAELIDAKHNSVSNWENNQNKPDPDTIERICGVLDISPSYLLGTKDLEPSITDKEKELLNKYNELDEKGKHTVNTILDMEYNRCMEEKDYLKPVAAHNDNQNDEVQQQLIKNDLAKLRSMKKR